MTEPVPIGQSEGSPAQSQPRGGYLRSLMTLTLSVCALGFLAWMIEVHPDHQSLFGPAPNPVAVAVSQPAPAHPVGG